MRWFAVQAAISYFCEVSNYHRRDRCILWTILFLIANAAAQIGM